MSWWQKCLKFQCQLIEDVMKKILVIEDNKEEKEKAKQAVEAKGHYCYVAEDLHDAYLALGETKLAAEIISPKIEARKIQWDGIITDIHFPMLTSSQGLESMAEAYGVEIAILASQNKVPCVMCSDVNRHHSAWIRGAARRLGVGLVEDKGLREDSWKEAVKLLEEKFT